MASADTDTPCPKTVIKAAKKALKRSESGTMKIKALAKEVAASITPSTSGDDSDSAVKSVRKVIEDSAKFSVEGKNVSLLKEGDSKKEKKEKKKRKKDGKGRDNDTSPKKRQRKEDEKKGDTVSSSSMATAEDASSWRREHGVIVRDPPRGEGEPAPETSASKDELYRPFSTFALAAGHIAAPLLNRCTVIRKFTFPSAIQAQCWPVMTRDGSGDGRRRDVVGIAETGSGKTLAFAMPALTAMYEEDRKRGSMKVGRKPRMLVLAPTRELAMQSHDVLEEYGADVKLTSTTLYGGVPKQAQRSTLRKGVDCLVATPGRMKDLIDEGSVDLSKVRFLVLDEADRMLDMGFEQDVRYIVSQTMDKGDGRRTAMFSATWPPSIAKLAMEYMVDPVRVYVRKDAAGADGNDNDEEFDEEAGLAANKRVKQIVEVIEGYHRDARLRELLKPYTTKGVKGNSNGKKQQPRVLIFALYKKEAENLDYKLQREGYDCASIHGNKNQNDRTKALSDFRDGSCPILVATDVAARGLDIPDVEAVINFTFPLTIEDYVHRIGRTGRAGKDGTSYTFFQSGDKARAGELQHVLRRAGQDIPEDLMKFGSTIKKKEHSLYGSFAGGNSIPMKKATKIIF